MVEIFSKLFPVVNGYTKNYTFHLAIGLTVFLLLYILQPFELDIITSNKVWIILGYAILSATTAFLFFNFVPSLFPNIFNEAKLTLTINALYLLVIILFLGTLNFIYTVIVLDLTLGIRGFLMMEAYTFRLAVFPILLYSLLYQIVLSKKIVTDVNQQIDKIKVVDPQENETISTRQLFSENSKESLTINVKNLLFVVSRENYVEVVYEENGIKKSLLRNSLKNIESAFSIDQEIYKCHRSYLVNLYQVKSIVGNSQSLKLKIKHFDKLIPVSRNKIKELQQGLEQLK